MNKLVTYILDKMFLQNSLKEVFAFGFVVKRVEFCRNHVDAMYMPHLPLFHELKQHPQLDLPKRKYEENDNKVYSNIRKLATVRKHIC